MKKILLLLSVSFFTSATFAVTSSTICPCPGPCCPKADTFAQAIANTYPYTTKADMQTIALKQLEKHRVTSKTNVK